MQHLQSKMCSSSSMKKKKKTVDDSFRALFIFNLMIKEHPFCHFGTERTKQKMIQNKIYQMLKVNALILNHTAIPFLFVYNEFIPLILKNLNLNKLTITTKALNESKQYSCVFNQNTLHIFSLVSFSLVHILWWNFYDNRMAGNEIHK